MKVPSPVRHVGKVIERVLDNPLVDLVTGEVFDRPLNSYLDWRKQSRSQRVRVYLDADGNRIAPPRNEPR